MIIRSILTLAVLGSLVFGAAAQAEMTTQRGAGLTAQIDGIVSQPEGRIAPPSPFASEGGLGTTR